MYVFLLAGCEVTLSAIVISLGNFLCLTRKQKDAVVIMEMTGTATEREGLNHGVEDTKDDKDKEEMMEKENGKVCCHDSRTDDNCEGGGE